MTYYLLAADAVHQVGADVQRATAVTTDYDGVVKRVYRVHTDTVALSAKMTPVIFGQASFLLIFALVWLFIAVGPRPPRGDAWLRMGNWYNFFATSTSLLPWRQLLPRCSIVGVLYGPAKITSAC